MQDFIYLIMLVQMFRGKGWWMSADQVISVFQEGPSITDCSLSADFDYVLTDNAALNATLDEFEAATITYSTIDSDGYGEVFPLISNTLSLTGFQSST